MIYLEYTEFEEHSGAAIILTKGEYKALLTMAGSTKSPLAEKSLWLGFGSGSVCVSNSAGLALLQDGCDEKDWSTSHMLQVPIADTKEVLASIKGKDAASKAKVGCFVFMQTTATTVQVIGLLAPDCMEPDFSKYADGKLPGYADKVVTVDVRPDRDWAPWKALSTLKSWKATGQPYTVSASISKTLTEVASATQSGRLTCYGEFKEGSSGCVKYSLIPMEGRDATWHVLQGTLVKGD